MSIKSIARSLIKNWAPRLEVVLHARNLRQHFAEKFGARQRVLKEKLFGREPPLVLTGPFNGLKYIDEIVWGPILPKWIGSYECELHPIIDLAGARGYTTVVDIGSAEGYYAVGLARLLRDAHIYSFDVDPWGRAQQRRLAKLNAVQNLTIGGFCSHRAFDSILGPRTLLVCDIEGYEYGFLDPAKSRAFAQCDIVVELHPSLDGSADAMSGGDLLTARFSSTHQVVHLSQQPRTRADFRMAGMPSSLSEAEMLECLDECRDVPQSWMWLRSRILDDQPVLANSASNIKRETVPA